MLKRFFSAFLALLLLLTVTSCASPALNKSGSDYVHEKTGVSYRFAPSSYAAQPSGEAIARIVRPVSGEEPLYAVEGRADERFLATGTARVLFDVSKPLPSLEELPVSSAVLYNLEMNMAMSAMVTDAGILEEIKQRCNDEVFFDAGLISPSLEKTAYELRLLAAGEFSGLYYCLQYWRCSEDVLIYEEYTDDAAAELRYPGIPYTVVTEEGIAYACYNFGSALFYDPVSGQCRTAADLFASDFAK